MVIEFESVTEHKDELLTRKVIILTKNMENISKVIQIDLET